jgi:hypothetical protein
MNPAPRWLAPGAVISYALVYGAALAVLGRDPNFEAGESLGVLLIFGLLFSGIAWAATRGITPNPTPVVAPARETGAYLFYLALFAVLALGPGLTWVKAAAVEPRWSRCPRCCSCGSATAGASCSRSAASSGRTGARSP